MKIVQINSHCGNGSTGRIAVAVSKRLNDHGIENRIFYSPFTKSDYPDSIMIGSKPMLRFHQLLSRVFGDQGFHSYFSTKKLVRRLKEIDPDLILLHNLHGYYLHLGVLFRFLKEYDKPVLWTLHDCWAFTGHCTHYQIARCDRWQSGCHDCPNQKEYPYSWLFDRSRSLYKRKKALFTSVEKLMLITPSDWLRGELKQSFLKEIPAVTIHNGIDLAVFKPTAGDFRERYGIGQKKMILGVSSVWKDAKGLDVFISLARQLDPEEYAVVLVGTDKEIDNMLPQQIISIHRTEDREDLVRIYSAADVFVNATREDTFPTVNLEALACGTPVVTFDTGGCSETIAQGCGALITGNSVDELLESLQSIRPKTDEVKIRCAAAAQAFAEQICYERYVDLIKNILTHSG